MTHCIVLCNHIKWSRRLHPQTCDIIWIKLNYKCVSFNMFLCFASNMAHLTDKPSHQMSHTNRMIRYFTGKWTVYHSYFLHMSDCYDDNMISGRLLNKKIGYNRNNLTAESPFLCKEASCHWSNYLHANILYSAWR